LKETLFVVFTMGLIPGKKSQSFDKGIKKGVRNEIVALQHNSYMNISMRDVFLVATLIVVVVVDVTLGISPPTNSTAPRHTCIHDKIAAKIKIKSVVIPGLHEDFGSVARRSAPGKSPMRLKLDYSSFSHLSKYVISTHFSCISHEVIFYVSINLVKQC
jgi:hypothetical protein